VQIRQTFTKFFADRGTHLAAMIAYFALLSFVPLLFLALSLLGFSGRPDESSYFVTEFKKIFPTLSVNSIVARTRDIQAHATSLGIVGAAFLLWSSLSLFSVLESAFNIVYDRPNRPFLHGKARALVFMIASLFVLFIGLLIGGLGAHVLNRYAPSFLANTIVAHTVSILVSTLAVFVFLLSSYRYLTNADLTVKQVLPGSIVATIALEATFQLLPVFLWLSKHSPSVTVVAGPISVLIWLYVMANVIVFGAEVNWMRAQPAAQRQRAPGASARASRRRRARPSSASRPPG
jgi:membrane protein